MKKWLLAALLLAGSASAQQPNNETVPPQCTVAQLAAGTCAPAKIGTRVRVSNNNVATGDTNCASGTGAFTVLCEYNNGAWVSIDTLYELGPAGSGAPDTLDFLVGTATGALSNEIVAGATPGGDLAGTWAAPTIGADKVALGTDTTGNYAASSSEAGPATSVADNSVDGTDIAIGSDAAGDTLYYNGTNYVRLPKGTAGQVLEMNAGATAPEWDTDDTGGGGSAEYFYAVDYASIQAAVTACDAAGGGTVVLPQGKTTIDMTGDADSIAISLPSVVQGTSSSINNTCNLLGYGDLRSSQNDESEGSDIHITNSAGMTGIMMDAGGVTLKGFRLFFENQDASTIGIDTGDADSDAFGYRVVDVTVASDQDDNDQLGTGIIIRGNLEGVWENVSSINWKYGVRYMEKFSGAAGNNVIWIGGRFAVNETGVFMGGGTETTAFGNTQFYGTVVEGNTAAAFNLNVSDGRLMLFGVHTESNVADGIIVSGSGRYECYDCKIDETGHDALQRDANVGPDVVYGGWIKGDIEYTAPGTVNWSGSPTLFTSVMTGTNTVNSVAVQTKTSDYTITLNDAVFWKTWDNTAAGGTVIYTLPSAIKGFGLNFCQTSATQILTVDPAGVEFVEMGGASLGAGVAFSFAAGNLGCIRLESLTAGSWRAVTGPVVAGPLTLGTAAVSSITLTTDGTGTGEVVLPLQSVAGAEIVNNTLDTTQLAATLTFADADLVTFGANNVTSATEGLILPGHATDCSTATAEGQTCWEQDAKHLWIGDGAAAVDIGPGAGSSGWTDSGTVLHPTTSTDDLGNDASSTTWSITDAGTGTFTSLNVTPSATPNILLTDSTTAGEARIAANDAAGPDTVLSLDADIASNLTTFIEADGVTETVDVLKPLVLGTAGVRFTDDGDGAVTILGEGNGTDEDLVLNFDDVANTITITSNTGVTTVNSIDNSIPTADLATEVRSMYWGAASLSVDGTQCATPAEVTINSGPKLYTIICTDNDASTIYGSVVMPDSWDGGTVTFQQTYIQTAADTNVLNGDVMAQCRGNGEVPSSTWGTEVAIDDAAVVGSNSNDQTTSGAVTPAGTCAAGDVLYWRWQLDATGTTTAVATLHTIGFKMEYTSNVGD